MYCGVVHRKLYELVILASYLDKNLANISLASEDLSRLKKVSVSLSICARNIGLST
jgi:hypothetical protein